MKTLPIRLSDEVAEYIVSALVRQADTTKEASLVLAQESWIGEEPFGPQVMLGFFKKGTHPEDGLYAFHGHVIAVSQETITQLQDKKLVFERFQRQTAAGRKATKFIRAISYLE